MAVDVAIWAVSAHGHPVIAFIIDIGKDIVDANIYYAVYFAASRKFSRLLNRVRKFLTGGSTANKYLQNFKGDVASTYSNAIEGVYAAARELMLILSDKLPSSGQWIWTLVDGILTYIPTF